MTRSRRNRLTRSLWVTLAMALLLVTAGCSELRTEYGKSRGASGRKSLNGFGALRESFEQAGFRTRDVSRLSDRVSRTDVIIWTPQMLTPIGVKATGWFDRWLRRGGRTLVYIVPDSGSEADYWQDAGDLAPPDQRLEYRKRAAKSINQRMLWRINRESLQSNGWFRIEPTEQRESLGEVSGAWDDEALERPALKVDAATEFEIVAFDPDAPNPMGGGNRGATGPGAVAWPVTEETSPTKTPIDFAPLLLTENGKTIVAEVRSERWRDSKILVVAGGSLLTNYAFTKEFSRELADQIVDESKPVGSTEPMAGFLTTSWSQVPVSQRREGVPKATGMELLTVWPLSIVTTHGVMLGLVICLVLWPIFGRPRRIRSSDQADFGDHLDAVAALMRRTGGEAYARARISEYMKRMHHETSGPWVQDDSSSAPIRATAPPRLSSGKPANAAHENKKVKP